MLYYLLRFIKKYIFKNKRQKKKTCQMADSKYTNHQCSINLCKINKGKESMCETSKIVISDPLNHTAHDAASGTL